MYDKRGNKSDPVLTLTVFVQRVTSHILILPYTDNEDVKRRTSLFVDFREFPNSDPRSCPATLPVTKPLVNRSSRA